MNDPLNPQVPQKMSMMRPGMQIDLDRGVTMTTHPSGVDIYMYKDEPGVYLSAFGRPLPEQLAKEAGMPVDVYGRARRKKELIAAAHAQIERDIEEQIQGGSRRVLVTRDGLHLVDIGLGRHIIEDADGNVLTKEHMSEEYGRRLFDQMVPPPEEPVPPVPPVEERPQPNKSGKK